MWRGMPLFKERLYIYTTGAQRSKSLKTCIIPDMHRHRIKSRLGKHSFKTTINLFILTAVLTISLAAYEAGKSFEKKTVCKKTLDVKLLCLHILNRLTVNSFSGLVYRLSTNP